MQLFDPNKKFYKGNLHLHTKNSDGRRPVEEAIEMYQQAGYDFLAVTDHWKCTVSEHFEGNMLMIPGIEFDYYLPGETIHIVGVGAKPELEGEKEYRHLSAQHGIDAIRACGGRAILAHPAWSLNTPQTIAALRGISAAEIFNTVSNAPWNGDRGDSMNILDNTAAHGCVLNTVAADDAHFYEGDQCVSYIMAQLDELSLKGVLDALDRGAYYATQGPRVEQVQVENGQVTVTCSPVCQALFHSNLFYARGRCVRGEGMTSASYEIKPGERFIRICLTDEKGRRAWVNPIEL